MNCGKEDEKNVHLERMKEICSELLDIDFKITKLREERNRLLAEQSALSIGLGLHLNNPLNTFGLETPGSILPSMYRWPTMMPYMPNPTYMQQPKQEENKKEEINNGNVGNDSGS